MNATEFRKQMLALAERAARKGEQWRRRYLLLAWFSLLAAWLWTVVVFAGSWWHGPAAIYMCWLARRWERDANEIKQAWLRNRQETLDEMKFALALFGHDL